MWQFVRCSGWYRTGTVHSTVTGQINNVDLLYNVPYYTRTFVDITDPLTIFL